MMICVIYNFRDISALNKVKRSNKGGLVMYLSKPFNYKVILSLNQYNNWEGQFIKVTNGGLGRGG